MIFRSERELVETFVGLLKPEVWRVYPETCNFDLVLHRIEDGFQIGVEAKLKLGTKVISQAADLRVSKQGTVAAGPDCRAVLVPWKRERTEYESLLKALGVVVLRLGGRAGAPWLSQWLPDDLKHHDGWPEHYPAERLTLPDYVPDVPAGVAAPVKLTMWKVKAIKLRLILERRGFVTRQDFKRLDMSPSTWTQRQWIVNGPVRGQWIEGTGIPDFASQHPVNYAQIAADYEVWNRRDLEGVI